MYDASPRSHSYGQILLLAFAAALATVWPIGAAAAAEPDIVIFANGDRLSGELKSLSRGKLSFDAPQTGTIPCEWDDVERLSSPQDIRVELEDGSRYFGKLVDSGASRVLVVNDNRRGTVELDMDVVVNMQPIESTNRDRFDLAVTAGYRFVKASEITTFNFGLDTSYETELRRLSLHMDSVVTATGDAEGSQRQNLDFRFTRLRKNRWLTGGLITVASNDELGLDLRTTFGGGGGRTLRQTNHNDLSLTGGLVVSREEIADQPDSDTTIEGIIGLNADWFRYDDPELDFSTRLQLFPSLTRFGRLRANLDSSLSWEFLSDLSWVLTFYYAFDSDPVATDAGRQDYGIITSIGWEF